MAYILYRREAAMKKSIGFSAVIIGLLVVAIVAMSVGFAVFSSNLEINGKTTVESSTWNIQFDEESYSETMGSETTTPEFNVTSMTYAVTLTEPGDFYEFTVNVENNGTFDAQLTGITLTDLTPEQEKYLTYTLTYASTPYTSSQSNLSIDLAHGSTAPVKVRVEYIQPENPADLPSETTPITLNATLNYLQKA